MSFITKKLLGPLCPLLHFNCSDFHIWLWVRVQHFHVNKCCYPSRYNPRALESGLTLSSVTAALGDISPRRCCYGGSVSNLRNTNIMKVVSFILPQLFLGLLIKSCKSCKSWFDFAETMRTIHIITSSITTFFLKLGVMIIYNASQTMKYFCLPYTIH